MIEVLVWMLVFGTLDSSGGNYRNPMYFKTQQQCMHVSSEIKTMHSIRDTKCIQANIYIQGK